jgi:hypothetical protein
MSEWMSIPAAWGRRTLSAGAVSRGGRGGGAGWVRVAGPRERLCRLMVSATLWGMVTDVSREGRKEGSFPNGIGAA